MKKANLLNDEKENPEILVELSDDLDMECVFYNGDMQIASTLAHFDEEFKIKCGEISLSDLPSSVISFEEFTTIVHVRLRSDEGKIQALVNF